jgi:hypothetical protein
MQQNKTEVLITCDDVVGNFANPTMPKNNYSVD